MKETAGNLVCGKGHRYGVVVSRWNDFFTEKMLGGAVDTLVRHGADEKNIHLDNSDTVCRYVQARRPSSSRLCRCANDICPLL